MLAVTNLADDARTADLGPQPGTEEEPVEVLGNRSDAPPGAELKGVEIDTYGYRWIRLGETPGR